MELPLVDDMDMGDYASPFVARWLRTLRQVSRQIETSYNIIDLAELDGVVVLETESDPIYVVEFINHGGVAQRMLVFRTSARMPNVGHNFATQEDPIYLIEDI